MIWLVNSERAWAGRYNPTLDIGDPAPAWQELPGTDRQQHALRDLQDKELVIVVFTCNSCPYAVDYEDRLIELTANYAGEQGKVGVVAINVNRTPEDSLEAMKERAKEKGFNFPYLYDHSQEIARKYGAVRTPEFFLLDRDRRIIYMGAMDDSAEAAQVNEKYLEQAITAALAGQQPRVTETPPVGCAVRYVRQRRK